MGAADEGSRRYSEENYGRKRGKDEKRLVFSPNTSNKLQQLCRFGAVLCADGNLHGKVCDVSHIGTKCGNHLRIQVILPLSNLKQTKKGCRSIC